MRQSQLVSYKGNATGVFWGKFSFSNERDSHKSRMLFILLDLSFTWENDRLKFETLSQNKTFLKLRMTAQQAESAGVGKTK